MHAEPSGVPGVELRNPEPEELGPVASALIAALEFTVAVRNHTERNIALLGVRFDMIGSSGRKYSVVHYADTLRYPEQAAIRPGAARIVCAEPLYTELLLGRPPATPEAEKRAQMNLENLRRASRHRASIDCIAFSDGEFHGPDSNRALARYMNERSAEEELVRIAGAGVLSDAHLELLLERERTDEKAPRTRRNLAGRMKAVLESDGASQAVEFARNHRTRIALWRP
jgi:hypothetical protein